MGHADRFDPVIADTSRYYEQLDRQDAYNDEIYRRACEIGKERIGEVIEEIYNDATLQSHYEESVRVITNCATEASVKAAADDLGAVCHEAAMRLAKEEYKIEMQAAIEALAVDRYYARMERVRG